MTQATENDTMSTTKCVKHDTETSSKPSMFDTFARWLAIRLLQRLEIGRLVVVDGDGSRLQFGDPSASLQAQILVHHSQAWSGLVSGGTVGAAEGYMNGHWSSPDLTAVVRLFVRNQAMMQRAEGGLSRIRQRLNRTRHNRNANSRPGSRRNIAAHYDLGAGLFSRFLDPSMMYSSAIYPRPDSTLEEAALHKLQRICDLLELSPDDHLLEIGTGWGGLAVYAAHHSGCRVTTTTISEDQYRYAKQRVEMAGLSHKIEVLRQDYRDLTGQFDKLVSVEMIEAVGAEFFPAYFRQLDALLKPNGLCLIQAITIDDRLYDNARTSVDFIQRYIFPGGCLPAHTPLLSGLRDHSRLSAIYLQDFGAHYARTLRDWRTRFLANWDSIAALGYDRRFKRMWEYYLSYCEGGFAERSIGVSHLLLAGPERRPAC
ncbi:MAG: cyclopropane-fatty-acyl-phospholipid synthase family protein [Pseudomonadota bacterium]|nr:cyclopropane-fatty-acyl-phospholipid synthase family protein [Pseudomonadota bacterium]